MSTKTYVILCYFTGYVIAPALSILMVMGAMEYIRSDVPTTNGVFVDGTA
tara:strand:+ start:305 stop:454 length:150 start_codon:yes stop_codon:yes gene_type:complete